MKSTVIACHIRLNCENCGGYFEEHYKVRLRIISICLRAQVGQAP